MIKQRINVWRLHGTQGLLMQRLARYSVLGWALFVVTAIALFVLQAVAVWRTPPIVAVDRSGVILGNMEWWHASSRSSQDIMAASLRFVRDYVSADSATIVPDYVQALEMMASPFRHATVHALAKSAYIARVRQAHMRSWVTFAHADHRPRILSRSGRVALVRVSGTIHIVTSGGLRRSSRFTLLLTVLAVARNPLDTAGVLIEKVERL